MEFRMHNERSAGILLHITSLPGPFGIGDTGPAAYKFADQLAEAGQRYWLMLPLNPVREPDFSPYSCIGSMAGNTLLISPEKLMDDGLLKEDDIAPFRIKSKEQVDFSAAAEIKAALLDKAYKSFQQQPGHPYHHSFRRFCDEQAHWLNDYATYRVLCTHYDDKHWQEWDKDHYTRNCKLTNEQHLQLEKEQWGQFVFDLQWKALKKYCNQLGVLLFGDLPIYIHPAAADVWAHPDLFAIDETGNMTAVAGVPPDYFNSKGQLWQMPVYNWDKLKEQNYDWWIRRIMRNLEWFDVLRLDHFRAFSAYWQIEAGESSAVNGKWVPGPANDFFDALHRAFPDLPLVAEDLGIIDDPVRKLRDDYDIPGMRILQFAFGEDMAGSEYIPHRLTPNAVLLPGTHDNDTTRGWFKSADKTIRRNFRSYIGERVIARNAAEVMSRIAYAAVCNTVILPMQDIIGLPASARMNNPAGGKGNWTWRMLPGQFKRKMIKRLKQWAEIYGRKSINSTGTSQIHTPAD